jgi:hypothetical protein
MVKLLKSFGLEGFPLFTAAAAIAIAILFVAFLMATRREAKKRDKS